MTSSFHPTNLREVVVTGIGLVTSAGFGAEATWEALIAGHTGVSAAESDEARAVDCAAVARVGKFRARDVVQNRKSVKLMTRPVILGMAAAKLAVQHASLSPEQYDPERTGVFVGAGQAFADRRELERALDKSRNDDGSFNIVKYGQDGLGSIHPLWLLKGLSNNVLGFVSLEYNAQGINNNYCNSGISSSQAILEGAHAIREGRADVIFAGGYDEACGPENLLGYGRLGLLSPGQEGVDLAHAHRPYDAARNGLVPAEGACFLILEERQHALDRGATPIATLLGGGVASGAFAITDPNPDGTKLRLAIKRALLDSGLEPRDVNAVIAHGAASVRYDPIEAHVLNQLAEHHTSPMLVTTDKAALGHSVAAAGGLSAGVAALSVQHGVLPHIASLQRVSPECQGDSLKWVVETPSELPADGRVLVTSAGLGGQAAALVFGRA